MLFEIKFSYFANLGFSQWKESVVTLHFRLLTRTEYCFALPSRKW